MWGLTGECTARVGRAWKTREINGWKVRGLPVRGVYEPGSDSFICQVFYVGIKILKNFLRLKETSSVY